MRPCKLYFTVSYCCNTIRRLVPKLVDTAKTVTIHLPGTSEDLLSTKSTSKSCIGRYGAKNGLYFGFRLQRLYKCPVEIAALCAHRYPPLQ